MCLSPILIKNPNYNHHLSKIYRSQSFLHDTISQYIYMPCGHCKQCIAVKQMYLVQRVQMEAFDTFMYFTTLTYDNEHLPKLSTSSGFDIPFVDYRHLSNLFKRLRKDNAFKRPFRYLAVSERGGEKGRPHVHILWFLPCYSNEFYSDGLSLNQLLYDKIKDNWCVYTKKGRYSVSEPLFTFHSKWYCGKLRTNYDTHFVVPSLTSDGVSSLAFYCCKYLLKPNDKERRLQQAFKLNLPEDEYEKSWNIVKSRSFRSSSFGLGFENHNRERIIKYLQDCVNRSDRSLGYPCFYSPDTGASFPLAPYYKADESIFTYKDMLDFKMETPLIYDAEIDYQKIRESAIKFERIQNLVSNKDLSIDLPFLFDD